MVVPWAGMLTHRQIGEPFPLCSSGVSAYPMASVDNSLLTQANYRISCMRLAAKPYGEL
jgi:hypothetical protein